MSSTQQQRICCICLSEAKSRGGEFLMSPGCCGAWFHQTCIQELIAHGKHFCPACTKPFPSSLQAPIAPVIQTQAPLVQNPVNIQNQIQQQQLPPPAPSVFNSVFNVFRRPSRNLNNSTSSFQPPQMVEIIEDEVSDIAKIKLNSPKKGTPEAKDILLVTSTPEVSHISTEYIPEFNVKVSLEFLSSSLDDTDRNPIDVVCILDVSGSMSGSKISHLQNAMKFVIGTLNSDDRLSIVSFSSHAQVIHGLYKMNANRKNLSYEAVDSLVASGGTDIYSGMKLAAQVLRNRRTRNSTSCVFLLTDGQDPGLLAEKKALASELRSEGTSLFVFGFGNDHDSEHLFQISNAADGSFIYVESNDTVIDAFGGAIGSQQGGVIKNIKLVLNTCEAGVEISDILCGDYKKEILSSTSGQVIYPNLFNGEVRDIIVKVKLPVSEAPNLEYRPLKGCAVYIHPLIDSLFESKDGIATISRLPIDQIDATKIIRDVEVDAHIVRLNCTKALALSLVKADEENFADAKRLLNEARSNLITSISFQKNHKLTLAMLEELNDSLRKLESRDAYTSSGGRAAVQERFTSLSNQRTVYSKASNYSWQTEVSKTSQQSAFLSKKK